VRSLPAHGRKRKIFRKGRHSAPSQVEKVAKRAGMAAPAVAVIGALAAAPHLRDHDPASTVAQAAARPLSADQLDGSAAGDLVKLKAAYRAPEHARHHHHHQVVRQAVADAQGAGGASTGTIVRKTGGQRSGVHCEAGSSPMLPENYPAIMEFLTEHGYTGVAAAGIAGNMYQESKGDPESAGGLIGWTPLPAGYVTGNPSADLARQLEGVLTFNDQYPQDVVALNASGSPTAAADIYMNDFERPGYPAAANREAAAQAVAEACGL
jgi:hypothetical protein